jgi:hypothetical protein
VSRIKEVLKNNIKLEIYKKQTNQTAPLKKGSHFASSAVKNKVEGILFAKRFKPNKEIKEAKK